MYLDNPNETYWGKRWGGAKRGKEEEGTRGERKRKKARKTEGGLLGRVLKGVSEIRGQQSEQYQNTLCTR